MDSRLVEVGPLPRRILDNSGLSWLGAGENADYFAEEFVRVSSEELRQFDFAARDLHDLSLRAVAEVYLHDRWEELGVPEHAIPLLRYSVEKESDLFLIGRFDFAGGMLGLPVQLIEYNADTCSLLPETSMVQKQYARHATRSLGGRQPFNDLDEDLQRRWRELLKQFPTRSASLLIVHLGHDEDLLNCEVIAYAARSAGFEDVQMAHLKDVIFSGEDGVFIEQANGSYLKFEFLYKFVPWEIAAYDEPGLWADLEEIIVTGLAIVLNPAWTFLVQNKALLQIMYELEPTNPYLLQTSHTLLDFPDGRFVRKPRLGRMGENIQYYDGEALPVYETEGDYEAIPPVYQALAQFNLDEEDHRYQPSVFFVEEPCALCFRRQDDLIIDDDAEFVGSVIV